MPSPGTIEVLDSPGGPGVRTDFGFTAGKVVAPFYDSLLGKIIVWATTRELAIVRAERVLEETRSKESRPPQDCCARWSP